MPGSGESKYDISNSAVVPYNGIIYGGDLIILRSKNEIDSLYFSYYITNKLKKQIYKISQGVSIIHLPIDDLSKIEITYPSIDLQKKLSRFLFLLDKKMNIIKGKIDILKKYKKGLLQKYIKLANQSTKIFKISSVCDLISGYNFTPNDYCEDGIYEVITIGNVLDERYVEGPFKKVNIMPSESILLHEDDLLISMTGNVGRTSFAKSKKQLLNQRVCKFNFYDQNNKDLVYFITKSDKFKRRMIILSQGGAQPNLKNKDILNFKCNILANEQNNIFIKCYKLIDEETILLKEKYEKLHLIKMQLIKDLFI